VQNLSGQVIEHFNYHRYSASSNDITLEESVESDKNDHEALEPSETATTPDEHPSSHEPFEVYSVLNDQASEPFDCEPIIPIIDWTDDALLSSICPEGMFDCFQTGVPVARDAGKTAVYPSPPGIHEEPAPIMLWSYKSEENTASLRPKASPNEPLREHASAPSSTAPLSERIGFLRSVSRHLGFTSLDAVLLSYYTARFDAHSALGEAQRRSRRRDLRDLLIQLSLHSHGWSHWESEGLKEALMESAEDLIRREAREWRANEMECKRTTDNEVENISRLKGSRDLVRLPQLDVETVMANLSRFHTRGVCCGEPVLRF
jgi:hypothetical protein